jgi:hypothetical protein
MNEMENIKKMIDFLLEKIEKLEQTVNDNKADADAKINDVNAILVEEVINPASEAADWAAKEERYDGWLERNGEKLAPYAEDAKLIEGDDYDLAREVFDTYDGMEAEGKPSEDEYIDSTIEKISSHIEKIKAAFGADKVELKVDENGEIETKIDGETVDEETVEEVVDGETEPEENPEDNADDIAAFEKELENYKG